MYFEIIFVLCVFGTSPVDMSITGEEPQCISRFDYDWKVLGKLIALEQHYEELKEISKQQEAFKDDIEKLKHDTGTLLASSSLDGSGSTYIRWGRTSCPENGTETLYTGFAAGSYFQHAGAAANPLCLPSDPLWGMYNDKTDSPGALVYGSEYQVPDIRSQKIFGESLLNADVPCAVCSSVRARVVMIPARNACYDGWTAEYTGYLSAGHYGHAAATEFVCLDGNPEKLQGSHLDNNGMLFYLAEGRCGSLRCPPYVNGRELTCVVCTK